MKQITASLALGTLVLGLTVAAAQDKHAPAAPQAKAAAPAAGSAQARLEMLKKLAGEWRGKAAHGQNHVDEMTVTYKVTSAGSTVMETLFAGADHEMITMYTLDGDDLVLTHYCSMGNQPRMKAAPANPNHPDVISFACTGHGGNMKSENDPHMHAAELTFVDADHIKAVWTMSVDGKPGDHASFELERKKG